MNDTIAYRLALPEDESALAELWWAMQSSHHAYDPLWYEDRGEAWCKASWREHFRQLLRSEQSVIVVGLCEEQPVGMIVAQVSARPPIYIKDHMLTIDTTVVDPRFRRKGLFKGMLAVLEERARMAGIQVIHLQVHHLNVEAARSYDRSGFSPETTGMIKWID